MTTDQSLFQQMSTDSQYMMKVFGPKDGASEAQGHIDLADPGQYRFVMNRLAAAGKTATNSPHLFERLEQTRVKAIAQAKAGVTTSAASSTDWCSSFILLGLQIKSGTTTTFNNTHPEVSCVGGASYVYTDVTTYNANTAGTESFVVGSAAGEDYSGGTNFGAVTISPTLPDTTDRVNRTDSLVIADDDVGNEQVTFNVIQSLVEPIPPSIALVHPAYHAWITNGGNIQMCQLRGSPTQCDYGVGSLTGGVFTGWAPNASNVFTGIAAVKANTGTGGVPWEGDTAAYFAFTTPYVPNDPSHVYLPTQGTLDVGATTVGICAIKSITNAKFRLIKTTSGGTCTTTTSFTSGFPNPIPAGVRTVDFRTISDFLNDGGVGAGDCSLNRIINESVKPSISITAQVDCGSGPVSLTASRAPGGADALPQRVNFLDSCFAEGTMVRRADGSTAKVETLKSGDKIISDNKGTVLTVMGTSHGVENEPLVELRDNKGHQLRLTSKHPVIKASGEVAFASTIQKDDQVMTDRGIARITAVTRIPYPGQVYNLKVGTPDEAAKVGKHGTTMFAGGFLVGDSTMQQENDKQRPSVAQLSKVWQRDFENTLPGNPSMQRILK